MIKYIFIIAIITSKVFSQENELLNHTYIIAPDKNTYVDIKTLSFEEGEVLKISNFITKEKNSYSYKIENSWLILNDSIYYGRIEYSNHGFKILDENNNYMNYIKLEKTELNENLKNIHKNSCWKAISRNIDERFCIDNNSNKILNVSGTYILFISNQWVFPINKITNERMDIINSTEDKILTLEKIKK